MTRRGSCAHGALVLLVVLAGPSVSAQPPRPDPPTYDCEPGVPDPRSKTCKCPEEFEPHVHETKIPFCKPSRRPRSRRSPAPEPRELACGELAPRVGVACAQSCGDVQRDSLPSPWNSRTPSWMPLDERLAATTRSCHHGPTANARVEASCTTEARHLSFGITASADRAGGCGSCAESSSVAAFEWRTRVASRSRAALFLKGTQTRGTAVARRCTLQVGAETRSWGDIEAGIVRSLDERDLDLHLTCVDPSGGLVSAGCHDTDDAVGLAIELETGPLPAPSIAATGTYDDLAGSDQSMQTSRLCKDLKGSVRGRANLDTATGRLEVDLALMTSSVDAGPKGQLSIDIFGEGGKLLATVESTEVGIGGGTNGYSGPRSFLYSSNIQLREYLAKRTVKLTIRAACTGSVAHPYPFGHSPADALSLRVK